MYKQTLLQQLDDIVAFVSGCRVLPRIFDSTWESRIRGEIEALDDDAKSYPSTSARLFFEGRHLLRGVDWFEDAQRRALTEADRPDKGPVCAMGSQPSRQQITRYAKSTCGPM